MSNLRKYRESLNISQTTLAKAVGCTQGAIGHWESGRRFPDLKTCRALVECPTSNRTAMAAHVLFSMWRKPDECFRNTTHGRGRAER
ncbi:helix-turn-helix transcriptional regulator [Escherichia coli]